MSWFSIQRRKGQAQKESAPAVSCNSQSLSSFSDLRAFARKNPFQFAKKNPFQFVKPQGKKIKPVAAFKNRFGNAVPNKIWPCSSPCFYTPSADYEPLLSDAQEWEGTPLPLPLPPPPEEEFFDAQPHFLAKHDPILPPKSQPRGLSLLKSTEKHIKVKILGALAKVLRPFSLNVKTEVPKHPPFPAEESWLRLKTFPFQDLASSCNYFSSEYCIREVSIGEVYRCWLDVDDDPSGSKIEANILCLSENSHQDFADWIAKVRSVALLSHPNLCKLVGFSWDQSRLDENRKILVYEHCEYGTLSRVLSKRQYAPPLSWSTRMNIALGAAKGLTYLHDRAPFLVPYTDFRSSNILIDKDLNAKLTEYCFQADSKSLSRHFLRDVMCTEDTYARDNVRRFGLLLLELISGGASCSWDEEDLVRSLITDKKVVFGMLDMELRDACPEKGLKTVANLIVECLHRQISMRPSMRHVADVLETLQDYKAPELSCSFRYSLPMTLTKSITSTNNYFSSFRSLI